MTEIIIQQKFCPTCGNTKPITDFYKNSSKRDGFSSLCGMCMLESQHRARHKIVENPTQKVCNACGRIFPATAQYFRKQYENTPRPLKSICKECAKKKDFLYRNNTERKELNRQYAKDFNKKLRYEVLSHYSNGTPKCDCCGEANFEFLAVDHTNGDGAEHRKKIGNGGHSIARWLKNNNFPNGFRVLCHNCNSAFGYYGYCPHQNLD